MRRKRRHIPEISERQMRERLDERIEAGIKAGRIDNAQVISVDCSNSKYSMMTAMVQPNRQEDLPEIAGNLLEAMREKRG